MVVASQTVTLNVSCVNYINFTVLICCWQSVASIVTFVKFDVFESMLKGHSGAELHIYFLVHLESIYYEIFFYSKIVPNCAVAK